MNAYLRIFISVILFFLLFASGCANTGSVTRTIADTSSVTGEWVIVAQTISPIIIAPLCKPIRNGTTFKFTQDTLEVYIDESGKPCDVYRFKITNNTISFIKEDMIWLCSYELNANFLKIKSNNYFTPGESDKSVSVNKQPTATQEVVVTLKRKNN